MDFNETKDEAARLDQADPVANPGACCGEGRTPIVVTLRAAGRGKFTATLDGHPLVERPSSSIIFAACRALTAAGVPDGPAWFRQAGSAHAVDAVVPSIAAGADFVAYDPSGGRLRIVRWTPINEEKR